MSTSRIIIIWIKRVLVRLLIIILRLLGCVDILRFKELVQFVWVLRSIWMIIGSIYFSLWIRCEFWWFFFWFIWVLFLRVLWRHWSVYSSSICVFTFLRNKTIKFFEIELGTIHSFLSTQTLSPLLSYSLNFFTIFCMNSSLLLILTTF